MTEGQVKRKIEWADRRCSLQGEAFTDCQNEYLQLVFSSHISEKSDSISNVITCEKCGSVEMYQHTKTKDKCQECGNIQSV